MLLSHPYAAPFVYEVAPCVEDLNYSPVLGTTSSVEDLRPEFVGTAASLAPLTFVASEFSRVRSRHIIFGQSREVLGLRPSATA